MMLPLLAPTHSFAVQNPEVAISGMVGFLVFSGFIIALGEANRRSKERSEREVAERSRVEDELRSMQAQLESRVQERTAELHSANQNLSKLSAQLLQSQDDERKRLARELHDSVGQLLAAIKMNSDKFQSPQLDPAAAKAAAIDNAVLIDQVTTEIRTMSHLLHPHYSKRSDFPLLSAGTWTASPNAARSWLTLTLQMISGV
jgi:signal transduction histidine kinase